MRRRSLKKRRSIKKYGGCNDFITHFNTIMNTIKNVEPENIKVPICELSNFKPEGEYPTNKELKYILPFQRYYLVLLLGRLELHLPIKPRQFRCNNRFQ